MVNLYNPRPVVLLGAQAGLASGEMDWNCARRAIERPTPRLGVDARKLGSYVLSARLDQLNGGQCELRRFGHQRRSISSKFAQPLETSLIPAPIRSAKSDE